MGLYDEIRLVGPIADKFLCAEGHSQTEVLQTKSLDASMDRYAVILINDVPRLHKSLGDDDDLPWISEWKIEKDLVEERIVKRHRYSLDDRSCYVTAYGYCPQCKPVEYRGKNTWRGSIDQRQLWNEATFVFSSGRLMDVVPVRIETRAELVQELRDSGLTVI
jgi:hypothetical protein